MLTPGGINPVLVLRIPADAYSQLARHPALRSEQPAATHRLDVAYFDTAQYDLRRSGLALRVQRDGASWTQTLERATSARAGLHSRTVLSALLPGPLPDPARFAACPLTDQLVAAVADHPLQRICVTQFTGSTRLLRRGPETLIEASLHRGRMRANGMREVWRGLELGLQSGAPAALYELALELLGASPIAVENRPLAERGYALHARATEAPAKGDALALLADMTVSEALDEVLCGVLAHIQANEGGLQRQSDPEYVHQMRVALRRLRSALSVFRPVLDPGPAADMVAEVRWVARTLGTARDWDVFMESAWAQTHAEFPDHPGLRAYAREFHKHQRLARRRAQRAVASARYQRLVLTIGAWLHSGPWRADTNPHAARVATEPVTAYAAEVLEARYARLRKRGRAFEQRTCEELHELRIAAKKLRYAAQFFASLYDAERAQELLARLARLQDVLGALNDAAAVRALVQAAVPTGAAPDVAEARGILIGWSQGQTGLLRREAERAWRSVRRCPTFW